MLFKDRLNVDLKDAMRNKDAIKRTVIRTLLSEIRNAEIAAQKDLQESDIEGVMSKQAQQRKDSIEAYDEAGRQDLVDKETAELNIITEYLPEQMTEVEIEGIIAETLNKVDATGPSDMGKVMGALMPLVKGRADGKVVNAMVTAKLKNL
ncbi:MAG: GatB/YqeY domain-containing protein [SAR202 cluster bacterium]|nr:GatB/YqeY domain-containing protein [SAR202 cluster bacterium]|tara:strand:- start:1052 stop:1501 length:450 start_codon:yes stop_codon:yes gene_type:complete